MGLSVGNRWPDSRVGRGWGIGTGRFAEGWWRAKAKAGAGCWGPGSGVGEDVNRVIACKYSSGLKANDAAREKKRDIWSRLFSLGGEP